MLKFCAIIFMCAGLWEVTRSEESCRNIEEECNPRNFGIFIPGTSEELGRFCRLANRFVRCVIHHIKRCDPDYPLLRRIQDVRLNIQDVCKAGTTSYAVVAENMGCIKEQIKKFTLNCDRDVMVGIETALEEIGVDTESLEQRGCVMMLSIYFCILENVEKRCSTASQYALLDLAGTIEMPFECSLDITHEFLAIFSTIKRVQEDSKIQY